MELIEETLGADPSPQGITYIHGPFYSNREMRRRAHRSNGEERREKMGRRERFERMVQKAAARQYHIRFRRMGGK